jgi:hypothetical protein
MVHERVDLHLSLEHNVADSDGRDKAGLVVYVSAFKEQDAQVRVLTKESIPALNKGAVRHLSCVLGRVRGNLKLWAWYLRLD